MVLLCTLRHLSAGASILSSTSPLSDLCGSVAALHYLLTSGYSIHPCGELREELSRRLVCDDLQLAMSPPTEVISFVDFILIMNDDA